MVKRGHDFATSWIVRGHGRDFTWIECGPGRIRYDRWSIGRGCPPSEGNIVTVEILYCGQ
jgi:hypothetical protein